MAGGGVGEAMLISAAIGGGSAAITGGDPLKGALLGGLGGAVAPGLGRMFGETVLPAAAAGAPAAALPAATNAGITALPATTPVTPVAAPAAANAAAPVASNNTLGALDVNYQGETGFSSPNIKSSFQIAMEDPFGYIKNNKMQSAMAALAGATGARKPFESPDTTYRGPLSRFRFNPETYRSAFAEGGITELTSNGYDRQVGEDPYPMASGGISSLGSYSDGGRMLKGPGDGMSDSIPASIANKRPARLADGEFVVPADVVSHLGNGSTDAGAKQLYAMMNKVRQARTGRKAQGREINPNQYVPA